MTDFDRAFELTIGHEGGYVHDRDDPGGETKFGISKRYHPDVDIKALTLEQAKAIYRRDYWEANGCDKLPWPLSYLLFDACVNQGPSPKHWVMEMQRLVGAKADGIIGPQTAGAARRVVASPHQLREVVGLFLAERALRYTSVSKPKFRRGLLKRIFVAAMDSGAAYA